MSRHEERIRQRRAKRLAAGGRPVELDCETATGTPKCWGCAIYGPRKCTEQTLSDDVHLSCEAEGHRLAAERGGQPCDDCAFRPRSPEAKQEGLLARVVRQETPFYCHKGMPLDGKGKMPAEGDYFPRDHKLYPICAGWARAQAARKDRP